MKRDENYRTTNTCLECRKHINEKRGKVGCWLTSQKGVWYSVHAVYHACSQFVPYTGEEIARGSGVPWDKS